MKKNNLFIISGPSGSGQDSIIEGIKKYIPIERVITTTTRPMRPGETQKKPYYFITQREFKKGIKNKKFFEYAKEYNNHYYGVTHKEIKRVMSGRKIGIWKMEYKGVMTAKKLMPPVIAILINAPLDILKKRIVRRDKQTSPQYLKKRMAYTKKWLKYKKIYDYEVMNQEGKLNKAVKEVARIIKTHLNKD